ncbi:ATP-binding protein [Runella salmonicolor]|uniref:histidine kinase n=1 Tax=Runella salmonicolor TaxID=2950278 RepID=A0ABT1FHD2_9BACT|nr:ATP-binding protein [Runella salmonicolor]MCP1381129.1 ATP-binding protein [Runella salmonicolor]
MRLFSITPHTNKSTTDSHGVIAFLVANYPRLLGFFVFFVLTIGLSSRAALGQKKVDRFLTLKGQPRLDSLELYYVSVWEDMDSTTAFKEINSVRTYAEKTRDELLAVYSEYLKARYHLRGIERNLKIVYPYLKAIQARLNKQKPNALTERLNADIEHFLGAILYIERTNTVKGITHLLSADLTYRKLGYENIQFADRLLAHLGLYYQVEVGDYKTAMGYFKEAESYIHKDPIDKYRIAFYKDYANCFARLKQYDKAIKYNKLAMAQIRLKRDSLKVGTISGNIGEIILNEFANPIEAEPYFHKELLYRQRYKPHGIDDIAKVYGNLCQVAGLKKNPEEVLSYFNKALKTIEMYEDTVDRHSILMSIYRNRMAADTLLGDYKSAFRYEKLYYEELMASLRHNLRVATSEASIKFDVEKSRLRAELANQQAQNSRFWVFVISLLLLVALIGGYFLYFRQRAKKEELAQRLSFEQKEAERLAELDLLKTRFFANISHEFRTPLTLLVGPLADFQKKYPAEAMIPVMQRNLGRLQALINQLLDLSKLEAGKMEPQIQYGDLPHFFQYLFASFESLAQSRKIMFQRSQSHEYQMAYFDEDKLEKIVTNLLSNAFKFTPENGRVTVEIAYVSSAEAFGGALITITVADSGIGIDPQRLPRIFDRFYQVDDSQRRDYEGTGIGLALVKELVNALRGTIEVKSTLGKGTVFVVNLPCDQAHWGDRVLNAEANQVRQKSPVVSLVEESKILPLAAATADLPILLIVEDNPDLRQYVRSVFGGRYQIEEAQDGEDGLRKAIELVPDIVICDLMMPRLDGLGFCKALKTDLRINHIPVVMLTAKATLEDRLEGLALGADDYLAKPFSTDELQIRVQNLLQQRLVLQQKYSQTALVAESLPMAEVVPSMDELFLEKALGVVEHNSADSSFDVEAFAEAMNMTSVQLRRKLKALTGQTVTVFVRNYRLEKAAELLRSRAGMVSDIAYRVGFESLPYFSKVFQERFGKAPSEWH